MKFGKKMHSAPHAKCEGCDHWRYEKSSSGGCITVISLATVHVCRCIVAYVLKKSLFSLIIIVSLFFNTVNSFSIYIVITIFTKWLNEIQVSSHLTQSGATVFGDSVHSGHCDVHLEYITMIWKWTDNSQIEIRLSDREAELLTGQTWSRGEETGRRVSDRSADVAIHSEGHGDGEEKKKDKPHLRNRLIGTKAGQIRSQYFVKHKQWITLQTRTRNNWVKFILQYGRKGWSVQLASSIFIIFS